MFKKFKKGGNMKLKLATKSEVKVKGNKRIIQLYMDA
jgi:hypothetical protein